MNRGHDFSGSQCRDHFRPFVPHLVATDGTDQSLTGSAPITVLLQPVEKHGPFGGRSDHAAIGGIAAFQCFRGYQEIKRMFMRHGHERAARLRLLDGLFRDRQRPNFHAGIRFNPLDFIDTGIDQYRMHRQQRQRSCQRLARMSGAEHQHIGALFLMVSCRPVKRIQFRFAHTHVA